MAKAKITHACQDCGAQFPKWSGQCTSCGAWNTLVEEVTPLASHPRYQGYATGEPTITPMCDITLQEEETRFGTGLKELDRVLGGGLVMGSVVLIGGDPGIGKSTLLLQTLCHLAQSQKVLYITGEESLQQVTMRAPPWVARRKFIIAR